MRRVGIANSIALGLGCVVLGMLHGVACAQEGEGATRVQRDADNPLRMIIEAGKLKPRSKGDESDPAAKPGAEAKPAKAVPPPQVATLPDILVPNLVPASAGTLAAVETMAFVPPAPYDADNYFGVPPPMAGDAATASRRPSAVAKPSSAPATAVVPAPAPRATLRLVDYVAPAIDERTRRRLRADGEVVLDFTVNPDGSVRDLSVRSASDRALEPAAIDAVSKWRYQPIASAQTHGVQLVFKRGE